MKKAVSIPQSLNESAVDEYMTEMREEDPDRYAALVPAYIEFKRGKREVSNTVPLPALALVSRGIHDDTHNSVR